MKICFVTREYPFEVPYGGIGTYMYTMAHSFKKMGHDVFVISSTFEKEKICLEEGIPVLRISRSIDSKNGLKNVILSFLREMFYQIKVFDRLSKVNKSNKIDIVEAADWGAEGLFLTLNKKFKVITRLEGNRKIFSQKKNGVINPNYFVMSHLEKIQGKKSDGISSCSINLAEKTSKEWAIPIEKIRVIPNPVDIKKINELARNKVPKRYLGGDYILYFGKINEIKGGLVLASALKKVFEEKAKIYAVFIGTGQKNIIKNIREIIKPHNRRLVILGSLSHKRLFPIVKKAKIVVLPSLYEPFGNTCIESLALGKKVIATSGSGFEEIIQKDGLNGYLVKPGSPDELCKKIVYCLNKKNESVEKRAKQRAKSFSTEKIAKEMIEFYREVINNRE